MCDPTALLDLVPGEGLLKRPSMDYNEYTYCYGGGRDLREYNGVYGNKQLESYGNVILRWFSMKKKKEASTLMPDSTSVLGK
ncbi:hypothetical protein P5V15_011825 [Pogonomyrmex californicus]